MSVRNPDFGVFETCPVAKHVRFSKSGHKCPDFEHPTSNYVYNRAVIRRPDFRPKPVPNRFGTGFGLKRLKTGQLCPVIGRSKSGHMYGYNPDVRNPDIFSSGLPNRTSGIRTLTVYKTV